MNRNNVMKFSSLMSLNLLMGGGRKPEPAVLRGFAIILVVLGHSCATLTEKIVTYSFHMPLFFFITGLFLIHKEEPFGAFFKKRVKSLLVPLLAFGVILSTYSIILGYVMERPLPIFAKYIGILVNTRHGDYGGSLWFLPSLFLVEMLLYIIHKTCSSSYWMLFISIVCAVAGVLVNQQIGQGLPWSLDISLLCVFFTALGYVLKDWIWKEHHVMSYMFTLVFFVISIYYNYLHIGSCVDLFSCRIGNPMLFYVSAICGIYLTIGMSKVLCKRTDHIGLVLYYGQNSLIVYALHFLFVQGVNLSLRWIPIGWVAGLLQTLIILLIQIPLINLVNSKFRWMTGKF